MRRVETLVVGGGPAGGAAAAALAAAGREVVLVERSAGPHHKVCGEFLSVETHAQLRGLGVDPAALGAVSIDCVALRARAREVVAPLPFHALSLSRYRLDEALLSRAAALGVDVRRSVAVRSAAPGDDGWRVACDDGTVACRSLVLATGKVGLRGLRDSRDGSWVGLKMHLRLAPVAARGLAGRVELGLLGRGYAGLEPVEDGIANLCLALPGDVAVRAGTAWPPLQTYLTAVLPSLGERLAGAAPLWERALAVVCPAEGYLQRPHEAAVFRVGDRLAHIPPFTGDGIAIALASAALAAEHILRGDGPAAYHAAARRLVAPSIRRAGLLARVAGHRWGGALLGAAAGRAPSLLTMIARRTRLPAPARADASRLAKGGARR